LIEGEGSPKNIQANKQIRRQIDGNHFGLDREKIEERLPSSPAVV